jgi:translation initiation factor 2A
LATEPQIHSSALAQADSTGGTATPTKPAGAYRPPHARGTLTPAAFKREDEGGIPQTNGFNNGIPIRERVVPGLAPTEPKDEKKTRSRKKKEKAVVVAAAAAATAGDQHDGASASVPAEPTPATPVVEALEIINAEDLKKIRALTKKLRAIEELKLRQAGGEKLEKTQEQKIEKEVEIVEELQKLGFNG